MVTPDYESPHDSNGRNDYKVTIKASDGRLSTSVHVTVTVTNVNERPVPDSTIANQTMTVGDSRIITLQGTFIDPDGDTLTYSASTSPPGIATASVNNSASTLTLAALSAGSATITVTAADRASGDADRLTASQNFTVTVDETNVPPTFNEGPRTTRSVAENTAPNTDVGSPVTASDADPLTYSLSGTDAGSFAFVESTGQIRTSDSLDFESKNSYSVTVTADDGNEGTASIDVTINVTDVNEAPVGSAIADRTLARGVLSREIDLSRYFSDPDTNDTLIYTAETPASDTDVATVSVERSMLTIERVSAGSATITVTAADRSPGHVDRLTATQDFTATVDETNVPPTFNEGEPATRSVAENTVSGADVGSPVTASDDDSDTLSYSLSGTDAGSFRIVGFSGQIRTFDSLNFEMKNRYSVTVTDDDGNGGTASIDVIINVNDVNEAPDGKPIANRTLASGVLSRQIDLVALLQRPRPRRHAHLHRRNAGYRCRDRERDRQHADDRAGVRRLGDDHSHSRGSSVGQRRSIDGFTEFQGYRGGSVAHGDDCGVDSVSGRRSIRAVHPVREPCANCATNCEREGRRIRVVPDRSDTYRCNDRRRQDDRTIHRRNGRRQR